VPEDTTSNVGNNQIEQVSELQPSLGLLSASYPTFNDEFGYPEIERQVLGPGEPNPVWIYSTGEFNEYVNLEFSSGWRREDADNAVVILSPYEAWHLMKQLDHWFVGRRVLTDD